MTATLALNKPDRMLRMLRGAERSIELSRANALSNVAPGDIETKPRSAGCSLRRVRRVLPARWRCALQISLILIFAIGIGSNEPLAQARDLSTQSVRARKAEWLTFRDRGLGIAFSYPSNRRVVRDCRGKNNCVALVGRGARSNNYFIAFELFRGGLETVAVERGIFDKKGDRWVATMGRETPTAEPIVGPTGNGCVPSISESCWQGLKAVVDCGFKDSNGYHMGECLWVVLSNGWRSVVADTLGINGIDEDTMRSIQSIRFTRNN
jgi:hypothetical protein